MNTAVSKKSIYDVIKVLSEAQKPLTVFEIQEALGMDRHAPLYTRLSELNRCEALSPYFSKDRTEETVKYFIKPNGHTPEVLYRLYYNDPKRVSWYRRKFPNGKSGNGYREHGFFKSVPVLRGEALKAMEGEKDLVEKLTGALSGKVTFDGTFTAGNTKGHITITFE